MRRRGNGEGSIYLRKDGRWEGLISIGFDERGRRRRRSIFGRTRREVAEKLAEELHAKDLGTLADPRGETLGGFLLRWLADVPVRESTRRSYEKYVRLHLAPALGRIPLRKLTAADVNALIQAKIRGGMSPQSARNMRAVLRNALNRAVRWGLVPRNVAELADPPRVEEYQARFLDIAEARQLLAAATGDRLEALYTVALSLGLRQGEALGLSWRAVDLERRTVRVEVALERVPGKGLRLVPLKTAGSRRALVMPDAVARALRAHRARQLQERLASGPQWQRYQDSRELQADLQDLVFTTCHGTPLGASHVVADSFRPIVRRAGLEGRVRFHDLRVSAATLLLAQGVAQRTVMEILGHSTLAMTTHYTKVVPQLMHDAAAAMDRALGS